MNYNYRNLPPFKWFILQNFPFIENDFDAITNYQMFCKLGEEINKVIESVNLTGEQVENLTNAYNDLKDYIDNYFENLDVQDEIDNKLDEMAEQGQLTEIIAQYLELQAVLGFATTSDMSEAEYISNGSFLRTYGDETISDGKGGFYYVRGVLTTDIIDGFNIVALADDTLVAVRCTDYFLNEVETELQGQITDNTYMLNDTCKILFPYLGQNAGDCSIIQEGEKNIIIDIGWSTVTDTLKSWLISKSITKIDYIIISHYHSDHIGGDGATGLLSLLGDSNFDFSDLVVYLPHKGINYNALSDTNASTLESNETTIKNYLSSHNITYVEPDNENELTLATNCKIKFLNIGSSFYSSYYNVTTNEYNNFSMVCELTHNNRVALFTGDIYIEAQNNLVGYIKQPDIIKAPHHDLEPLVSDTFMKKITSSVCVIMENQSVNYSGLLTPFSQQVKKNAGNIYSTNVSHNINIMLKNDNIMCQSDYGVFTNQSTAMLTCSGIHITNTDLNNLIVPRYLLYII